MYNTYIVPISYLFRIVGSSANGNLTTGDISFGSFKHGPRKWFQDGTEINVPYPGWYQITFSATHWSSSDSNKISKVDVFVNEQKKRTSYGTVAAKNWGQNFNREWFIRLNKDDKVKFRNDKEDTLYASQEEELFIKLQYITGP